MCSLRRQCNIFTLKNCCRNSPLRDRPTCLCGTFMQKITLRKSNALWRCLYRFTLIELLVVITILVFLLALLLPALNTARGVAKRAACMSNQKQVCVTEMMYANDFNGIMCEGVGSKSTQERGRFWMNMLTGVNIGTSPVLWRNPQSYIEGAQSKDIIMCPYQYPNRFCPAVYGGTGGNSEGQAYGWYRKAAPDQSADVQLGGGYVAFMLRVFSVPLPAKRPWLADTVFPLQPDHQYPQSCYWDPGNWVCGLGYWARGLHLRHLGKTNMSFFDGHVSSVGADWLIPFGIKVWAQEDYTTITLP